jgi:hypothetical protein
VPGKAIKATGSPAPAQPPPKPPVISESKNMKSEQGTVKREIKKQQDSISKKEDKEEFLVDVSSPCRIVSFKTR